MAEQLPSSPVLRIGTGAGFSSDRLGPAVDLARDGDLDWLVFECVGERTLAFGHRDRRDHPDKGYNPHLRARLKAVLPHCVARGTRIITNMGVANVSAAGQIALGIARELGLSGYRIALVLGDDVTTQLSPDHPLTDAGTQRLGDIDREMIGANAYLGAEAILPAIAGGADLVITGRVADPSLFLTPMIHHHGWALDDWDRLAQGTMVGHLMECGMQVTGGYFADPGYKDVPDLARCTYPIAEVSASGASIITTLADSGGRVDTQTVREQLMYEVHDPTAYITPDVIADFTTIRMVQQGHNRVLVEHVRGKMRPETLKTTIGFDGGWLGEASVSYAGPGAGQRAVLAKHVLSQWLSEIPEVTTPLRYDLIGLSSLHATAKQAPPEAIQEAQDVRLQISCRSMDREEVERVLWETEGLMCCGPAGGGGFRRGITPSIITHSALLPRDQIRTHIEWLET